MLVLLDKHHRSLVMLASGGSKIPKRSTLDRLPPGLKKSTPDIGLASGGVENLGKVHPGHWVCLRRFHGSRQKSTLDIRLAYGGSTNPGKVHPGHWACLRQFSKCLQSLPWTSGLPPAVQKSRTNPPWTLCSPPAVEKILKGSKYSTGPNRLSAGGVLIFGAL